MSLLDSYNQCVASRPIGANTASSSTTLNVPPLPSSHEAQQTNGTTKTEDVTPGSKPDLIDLTERQRPGGETTITMTAALNLPRKDISRYSEYGLRVVRKLNKDGKSIGTDLFISSPHVQAALRETLSSYAFINLAADPIVIPKPYAPLFHYRKELRDYTEHAERSDDEKRHLKVLFDQFYEPYLGETERIYLDDIPKGRVRFEYLWTLFRAEDDVLHHTEHYRELQRVMGCETTAVGESEVFAIYTWRWGYNAGKFGPCSETLIIPKFTSTREIHQLSSFPLKLLHQNEQDKIFESFIKRGRRWKEFTKPTHQAYDGPIWTNGGSGSVSTMEALDVQFTSGRIMLDHQLHSEDFTRLNDQLIGAHGYRLNGRELPNNLSNSQFPAIRIGGDGGTRVTSRSSSGKIVFNKAECFNADDYHMTDEEALLCPARTCGFSLQEKKFAYFLVEKVHDVDFREDSFKSLVLDKRFKRTVQALVESHDSTDPEFDDLVTGKGKGVIISLEGPPGSGKTLTAESIAEVTHKPLYAISTSELGTTADRAERGLTKAFRRTERWKAVVLLDEADLFLTKRSVGELDRNALVTVFLRTLEYFQGIMFLTSNRVEEFDPAFSSRIHLRIPFKDPGADVRSVIWKNLLPRDWSEETCRGLAQIRLNGREIKNLIRTSTLVAKYDKEPLSESIIRDMYVTYHQREMMEAAG